MNNHEDRDVNGHVRNASETEDIEMTKEITPESPADRKPKTRKARRTKAEIDAEYQKFKELWGKKLLYLEILAHLKITDSQGKRYLSRIGLESIDHEKEKGACKGLNLPEGILKMLGGTKDDIFRYEKIEDGVSISFSKLHQ